MAERMGEEEEDGERPFRPRSVVGALRSRSGKKEEEEEEGAAMAARKEMGDAVLN